MQNQDLITDIKNKFLVNDGLNGLNYDSTFIVFEHQACLGDCKGCFLDVGRRRDHKLASKQAEEFEVLLNNDTYLKNLEKMFELFKVIDYTEDLRIVEEYPVVKEFTKTYADRMKLILYTDSSTFSQYELNKNYNFGGYSDISYSEDYVEKHVEEIKKLLSDIYSSGNKVSCMKLIVDTLEDKSEAMDDLLEFASSLGIYYKFHTNIFKNKTKFLSTDKGEEHSEVIPFKKDIHLRIFDHSTSYLNKEKLMIDLPKFYKDKDGYTKYDSSKYTILDLTKEFTWREFCVNYLKTKLSVYKYNYELLDSYENKDDYVYNYFKYIHQIVQVNEDFNFVPYNAIGFNTNIRDLLRSEGFIDTPYGLFLPVSDTVIPLFSFKEI